MQIETKPETNLNSPTFLQAGAQLHINQPQLQNPAQSNISTRVTQNLEGFSHSWTPGNPGRKREGCGATAPAGLTLPTVSTFSSPASVPAGTGWKITGSFLSQHTHGTASSSFDKWAKEKKYITLSFKNSSGGNTAGRALALSAYLVLDKTWSCCRRSRSKGQTVVLQQTPEKL